MIRSNSRLARAIPTVTTVTRLAALVVVTAVALGLAGSGTALAGEVPETGTWRGAINPDALQILKRMTDHLGNLQRFSMHTENIYDDVLETGQKIQSQFSSSIVVQRPDKLRADRSDGQSRQIFVYDGETLSVHDDLNAAYATVAAPDNLDDLLHFARDALDLVPPAGDMVFSNAFELLTAGITSGNVIGKAVIGGVSCDHIAFTTPVVDWQVWVADGDKPLPYKYVLTTRDDPAQPQFITSISDWDTEPEIRDGLFDFDPPPTAMEIDFVRIDLADTSAR